MPHIRINHEGCAGQVEVDGVPLKGVTAATVTLDAQSLPVVDVRLIATQSTLDFKDGVLKVGDLTAPEALERALLSHLQAKYQYIRGELLQLPVVMGMDHGAGDDKTTVARFDAGGLVSMDTIRAELDPMEVVARNLTRVHGG